jgi:hypothetical protein
LIQALGGPVVAQQRPAARLDAEGEIVAAGLRRLSQPLERWLIFSSTVRSCPGWVAVVVSVVMSGMSLRCSMTWVCW